MASDESTAIVTGPAAFEAKVVMLRKPGPPPSPPPLPPPLPPIVPIAADVDTEDDEEPTSSPAPGPVRAAAAVAAAAAAKPGKRGSGAFNTENEEDAEYEDDGDADGEGTVSVYDAVVQPLNAAAGLGKRPSYAAHASNDGDEVEEDEEERDESEDGDTASAVVTGFKKQLISRWSGKPAADGGRHKRRRPTLVHYGEGQMPMPAMYAPGTRIGDLIDKELTAVRATGGMRVQVKMNLRGRAKLEAFLLNLTPLARGALRIAVPQLIGYRKALCGDGDATGVRLALADLDNRQLRLLDALFDRLRTRSVMAVWSIIVEETAGARGRHGV